MHKSTTSPPSASSSSPPSPPRSSASTTILISAVYYDTYLAGELQDEDPALRYANGDPVTDNPPEIQAFEAYVKAERSIPKDVDALREWVRETPQFDRGN